MGDGRGAVAMDDRPRRCLSPSPPHMAGCRPSREPHRESRVSGNQHAPVRGVRRENLSLAERAKTINGNLRCGSSERRLKSYGLNALRFGF